MLNNIETQKRMFVQREASRIFFWPLNWKNFTLYAGMSWNESSQNVTSRREREAEGRRVELESPENATMRGR